ncbi:ribonuclease H-like domain, reverse transcriptase, RNA-dependent DNA polymerase [Tanacetum coccineum]
MTRCVMKKKGWKWKAENSNLEGSKPGTFTVLWGDSQGPHEQALEDNEGPIDFGHEQPTTNQVLSPAHVNPNQVMSLTHVSLGHVFHSSTVHIPTVHEEDFNDEVTQIMIKRNADGLIMKYKVRLVAKGYVQKSGIDFVEVFTPIDRLETIRLLITLAAEKGWKIHQLDVKMAFLHGDLKEEVYVVQPKGIEVSQGKDCVKIKQERCAMRILKEYGYSDSSHNIDIDDGRIEFMGATTAGCQTIWLRELLAEVAVQGDDIVTWCARVTLVDSDIQGLIVGEF